MKKKFKLKGKQLKIKHVSELWHIAGAGKPFQVGCRGNINHPLGLFIRIIDDTSDKDNYRKYDR